MGGLGEFGDVEGVYENCCADFFLARRMQVSELGVLPMCVHPTSLSSFASKASVKNSFRSWFDISNEKCNRDTRFMGQTDLSRYTSCAKHRDSIIENIVIGHNVAMLLVLVHNR